MDDGARTHDSRIHNPGLYLLSYIHHRPTRAPGRARIIRHLGCSRSLGPTPGCYDERNGSIRPRGPPIPLRRTPCIGVCSTTYGDLVCRGCKRFAHEVVGWNGFEESQRALVWQRLGQLLRESVAACVAVEDECRLRTAAHRCGLDAATNAPLELVAYDLLRQQLARDENPPLAELGLAAPLDDSATTPSVGQVTRRIDREFHVRSLAHYERSYRVLAS